VARRCGGSGLLFGGLVLTLVGLGVALMPALHIPRYWTTAIVGVALLLAGVVRRRMRLLEHERAGKMGLEARLSSLQSRLHPHFLFNTLNAISALIHEDPERAERTVERLAALLRFSLDVSERSLVPLAQELKIVVDYLEIEKTRLGDRLSYTLAVDPGLEAREIPPFALQTLVENSVKYAVAPRPRGGRLRVEVASLADRLLLSVWDDGPGFTAADIRPGHGLENLQARLTATFGAAAALDIRPRDGGTLVTVALPRR
jgi:LytS/YehU family sensor histidine kinase